MPQATIRTPRCRFLGTMLGGDRGPSQTCTALLLLDEVHQVPDWAAKLKAIGIVSVADIFPFM